MEELQRVRQFVTQSVNNGAFVFLCREVGLPNIGLKRDKLPVGADDLGKVVKDNLTHLMSSSISTTGKVCNQFSSRTFDGQGRVLSPPVVAEDDVVVLVSCQKDDVPRVRKFLATSKFYFTPCVGIKLPYGLQIHRPGTTEYRVDPNKGVPKRAADYMADAEKRAFLHLQLVAELAPAKTFLVSSGWEHATPAYPVRVTVNLAV